MLESVRNDLFKESVVNALIDTDSQVDLLFPRECPQDDIDLPPPLHHLRVELMVTH